MTTEWIEPRLFDPGPSLHEGLRLELTWVVEHGSAHPMPGLSLTNFWTGEQVLLEAGPMLSAPTDRAGWLAYCSAALDAALTHLAPF